MSTGPATHKPVVVTRDEPEDGPSSSGLRQLGLQVLHWPVLHIAPPRDPAALDQALADLASFDWIVFASQHAVAAVTQRLSWPQPQTLRVAAVGDRTAQALRDRGWRVHITPAQATAEHLVDAMAQAIQPQTRVLFPASSRSLPVINERLTRLGARVHQVEAYSNEGAALDGNECRSWVERDAISAVTFTSPSAVHELDRALGTKCFDRLLAQSPAIVIGTTTAHAVTERGFASVLAEPPTIEGMATTTFRQIQMRS